jgi:hypothetical protein
MPGRQAPEICRHFAALIVGRRDGDGKLPWPVTAKTAELPSDSFAEPGTTAYYPPEAAARALAPHTVRSLIATLSMSTETGANMWSTIPVE